MRKFMRALMATAVVAVSCMAWSFGNAEPAAADPPGWASDGADWIANECHDIPTSLMGSASGTVVTKGVTPAGSGLGPTPTTIPTGGAPTTFENRNLTSTQLNGWLNAPPANVPVPATPPATGTVNAIVGSDEYMRALLGAEFWDEFATRNAVNADYRVPPQTMNTAFSEAGSGYRYPTLPQSTVGGSGSPVINTTGTIKGATDNTKSVVTPARLAGTGVSALSGSTVALSALTFGGAMCGTINVLGAVFGDPFSVYTGPTLPLTRGDLQPCAGLGVSYALATDYCLPFTAPALSNNMYIRTPVMPNGDPGAIAMGTTGTETYMLRKSDGTTTTDPIPVSPGSAVAVIPCLNPENNCGLSPHHYSTNATHQFFGTTLVVRPNSGSNLGRSVLNESWAARGRQRRLVATVTCRRPADAHITTIKNYSSTFWDDTSAPNWPPSSCNLGYAPTDVLLQREWFRGGGNAAATWVVSDTVLDWSIDAGARANATTLKCFVVGALSCPRHDLSPGNPAGNEQIGGPGGVTVAKTVPESDTVVAEVVDSIGLPTDAPDLVDTDGDGVPDDEDDSPDGDPDTSGGPGADPNSGGIPGTSTPTGDADEDACVPTGWGWLNPVEWVVKPLKCVLIWAFWDADAADEMGELWGDTGDPWVDTATGTAEGISFDPEAADACIPLDAEEICASHVLSIELPSSVSLLLTVVFTFAVVFEVIGLFARITGG